RTQRRILRHTASLIDLITTEEQFKDRALIESTGSQPVVRPLHAKRSIAWAQAIAFVMGASLLVYIIRRVGVQPIFTALGNVGFGFFLVVALSGLRHVLRTVAMSLSVPPDHRRFSFGQAFAARLGGESISFLTFTGPLLGEATKVALLRKRVPLVHGVP